MKNDDSAQIRTLIETWHSETARGNADALADLMAEDVVFLTPDGPPMAGRATFVTRLKDVLSAHTISSRWGIREIVISQTLAYCWTDLIVTVTPRDGSPAKTRRGPTLSIFAKTNDRWFLIRDANMVVANATELALKVNDLERELMADGPGG